MKLIKIWKNKNIDEYEKIENINLFSINTENYTIQKYNDTFYVRNKKNGYIDEIDNLYIKIE